MNEQERKQLINEMKKVFATKDDLTAFATKDDLSIFATKDDLTAFATKDDLSIFATKDDLTAFATKEETYEFRKEMNARFDAIEKDLKSVVRIYNLDEEMNAVYARLKQLEQTAG